MNDPITDRAWEMPCFVLGIGRRSGTNYLYRLLSQHPACAAPGPIWEDSLVHHAGCLSEYATRVVESWDPRWGAAEAVGGAETLLADLGTGLVRFVHRQAAHAPIRPQARFLLTKTPSVRGLEHFPRLFPGARALVLVRDGRSVVESGVRSFGWRYETAMREWATAATEILAFLARHPGPDSPVRLVRYEDLVRNEQDVLTSIFRFLGLDPDQYDFSAARAMGVTGSSELRRAVGAVHWKPVDKSAAFDPLHRHATWDRKLQERFAWLAGAQMQALGYTLETTPRRGPVRSTRQRLLDAAWGARRRVRSVAGRVRRRADRAWA